MRALRAASLILLSLLGAECVAPPAKQGPAPAFELRDLAGAGNVSLASLKGKVLVMDFWATWCGPCIAEIPEYVEFWNKNRSRGVEVIGVVCDSGEPQEIQDFVREHGIPYRQILGDDKIQEDYASNQGFPTTFVVDKEGMIRSKMVGSSPNKFERLQAAVDAALSGN